MYGDDYLRQQAAAYRQLAENAKDAVVKKELLDLADVCEEVANQRSGRSWVSHYHPSRAFALHVEPKRNRRRGKLVPCDFEPSLRRRNADIENWRAETSV